MDDEVAEVLARKDDVVIEVPPAEDERDDEVSSAGEERDDEVACKYVSSRGLLKSCDIRSSDPISSIPYLRGYDFSSLKDGSVVYVCASAMRRFYLETFPRIRQRIVLVTGDCDESVPDDVLKHAEFSRFIESDRITCWFAQNCAGAHPKLRRIPIGLDYHTLQAGDHWWGPKASAVEQERELMSVSADAAPFHERELKCYANFHFSMKTRFGHERRQALELLPEGVVHYEASKDTRVNGWRAQSRYAFVISPFGGGMDCHRTWEALCLGCIPVVKSSPMNDVFDDLPVLQVNRWSEVTEERLAATVAQFKEMQFDYHKLTLSYWQDKIRGVRT